MNHPLEPIFQPQSVAVIGASRDPDKWGYLMSKSLIQSDYRGQKYLVNINGGTVCGQETFRALADIEGPVDLAVLGIPARFTPDAVRQCVAKKVKAVIIASAHFGEHSEAGKALEAEVLAIARSGGVRIIGPNCLGVFNAAEELNTTLTRFPRGSLAFLSQSGNFGLEVNYFAQKRGLGFSKFVSYGNQADVQIHEYLDYIRHDEDTKVILLYIEGLKDGKQFLKVARQTTQVKPIVAIKAGVGGAGRRAAASHTGSLAGDNEINEAVFRQAGIIRVANSDELLDVGEALANCPLPIGNRIAILANGGGTATMATDAAEKNGLAVHELSLGTQQALRYLTAPGILHSTRNPIDFADEADIRAWVKISEVLLQDPQIDGMLLVGGFGGYTDIWPNWESIWNEMAAQIGRLSARSAKPVIVHSMFQGEQPASLKWFRQNAVPVYATVEKAMQCMGALAAYAETRRKTAVAAAPLSGPTQGRRVFTEVLTNARAEERKNLLEPEAREILRAYDLPLVEAALARDAAQAAELADELGYPVALKIVSPDILHKSDAGGVKLNLENRASVVTAHEEIIRAAAAYSPQADVRGVLVSPMAPSGIEIIVGTVTDPVYGATIMFGLGGVFVEALKDVAFKVVPVNRDDVQDMIRAIRGFPVLKGTRGYPTADLEAIADIILKVSTLVTENEEIVELDLNPIFVYPQGARIMDARVITT